MGLADSDLLMFNVKLAVLRLFMTRPNFTNKMYRQCKCVSGAGQCKWGRSQIILLYSYVLNEKE